MEEKEAIRDLYAEMLNTLFWDALKKSPFEVVCSLLRVGGMSDANWDPFEESRLAFKDYNVILDDLIKEKKYAAARRVALLMYCQAVEMSACHEMLSNLLRIVAGEPFVTYPFPSFRRSSKKKLFSFVPPSAKQKFGHIKDLAIKASKPEIVDLIQALFDERVRNAFSHSDYILTETTFRFNDRGFAQEMPLEKLDSLIVHCFAFYGAFLYLHRHWLKTIGTHKRFHKWPNYEVLELLFKEDGLYGFKVHFSNGSEAYYTRTPAGIEAVNILFEPDGRINYMVGLVSDLVPVWKINGKPVENWSELP